MATNMNAVGGGGMSRTQTSSNSASGWAIFGGVLLTLLGAMNVIHGITALQSDELLINQYLFDNLTFWGWAFLVWGVLQAVAGAATLLGTTWGPSLGMTLATIGAVGWFFMIFAAPAAAILGVFLSIAIIGSLSSAMADAWAD